MKEILTTTVQNIQAFAQGSPINAVEAGRGAKA